LHGEDKEKGEGEKKGKEKTAGKEEDERRIRTAGRSGNTQIWNLERELSSRRHQPKTKKFEAYSLVRKVD
jgi:hypothetical protein